MIQRFIELGQGFSDIYELLEIAKTNKQRLKQFLVLKTMKNNCEVISLAIILHPASEGKFQPIYISREGIPFNEKQPSKRYQLYEELAKLLQKEIHILEVKPSSFFKEVDLYYQYLIGILRMNHYLPPLD